MRSPSYFSPTLTLTPPPPPPPPLPPPPPPPSPGAEVGAQTGADSEGTEGRRRPATKGGGGLAGKRQRGQVGRENQEATSLVHCVLGEVKVGKGIVKGQVVIRLAEVVACRRHKQAKRDEDRSDTDRGTVDDEEGDMRRRGARECEEALMEAAEARRGYTRVAAWDEGNLIQAMARLKNPTIAWRYGDG